MESVAFATRRSEVRIHLGSTNSPGRLIHKGSISLPQRLDDHFAMHRLVWDLRCPPRTVVRNEQKLGRAMVERAADQLAAVHGADHVLGGMCRIAAHIESRHLVLMPDGSERPLPLDDKRASEAVLHGLPDPELAAYVRAEELGQGSGAEPLSIAAMRRA